MFVETKKHGETPLKEWQNDLLSAAEVIERLGWCQDTPGSSTGPVCVMGALHMAVFGTLNPMGHSARFKEAWKRLCDSVGGSCVIYNDTYGRTKEEMISALRAAARSGDD